MYIFQPDRYLLNKQIEKVGHYITGKVLDVGAGEISRYDQYFQSKEYIRMDVRHGEKVDIVGSADHIPLASNTFDAVVCTQVFEHLEHIEQSAKEIHRVLKKDGFLLVTVPQMNELHEEPYDFFRYTKYGLVSLFEPVGFDVVEISQRGGFFSTIAQMKMRYIIDRLSLYQRPFLGRLFAPLFSIFGRFCIYLDSKDQSIANKKHAIGWCIIFKKQ